MTPAMQADTNYQGLEEITILVAEKADEKFTIAHANILKIHLIFNQSAVNKLQYKTDIKFARNSHSHLALRKY